MGKGGRGKEKGRRRGGEGESGTEMRGEMKKPTCCTKHAAEEKSLEQLQTSQSHDARIRIEPEP